MPLGFRTAACCVTTTLVAALLLRAAPASAQLLEDRPDPMRGVGIDEKPGAELPLDLKFRNDRGKVVRLGDLFAGARPVLLSLNYSGCPMLCRVQLDGLVDSIQQMDWTTGGEFDIVSVSIDPLETPTQAALTKKKYVKRYGKGGASGWHFLVGEEANIRKLADTVGFRYKYDEQRKEYAHTAAVIVCSQEGVVSRYLDGVMFDPDTVRLSLVEASEGKVGSVMDRFWLTCYQYDHTTGRYGPAAQKIMAAGGALTVAVLGVGLLPYWLRRPNPASGETPTTSGAESATHDAAPLSV